MQNKHDQTDQEILIFIRRHQFYILLLVTVIASCRLHFTSIKIQMFNPLLKLVYHRTAGNSVLHNRAETSCSHTRSQITSLKKEFKF